MAADILTFFLLISAISYLIAGIISIRTIKKYENLSAELDTDVISRSILQPSVSIIVNLDLRRAEIIKKLGNILHLHYRNYDVIAVCNSQVNPAEFKRIITHFKLERDPKTGLYVTDDSVHKRLIVADKNLRKLNRILDYGVSLSKKRYIIPLYDIDHSFHPDIMARPATLLMGDPDNRTYKLTGVYRYVTEGDFMKKCFLAYSDVNNLRRTYLSGNVCDKYNQRGLKMYSRTPAKNEVTQFVPEPMMFINKPNKMGSYLEVMASGIYETKMCRIMYNISELFVSTLFVLSVVMWLFYRGEDRMDYLMLAASSFLLVLLSSNFAIYILEMIAPEKINKQRLRRLLLIAIPEAFLSVSLSGFATLRRVFKSFR